MTQTLRVEVMAHATDLPLPQHETADSAGVDLAAALEAEMVIQPGQRVLVPTGLRMVIPQGYEGQVRSRSGLSYKHGIVVLNAPGTIDADYRGEVKVMLINLSDTAFTIEPGMRVAQFVLNKYEKIAWDVVISVEDYETTRGAGGFGSTGLKQAG